jgi:hypothetical protein
MYHSGRPVRLLLLYGAVVVLTQVYTQVFHEGLKSWSCCEDVNRPVLDFDSFMLIPVGTIGLMRLKSLSIDTHIRLTIFINL